MAAYLIRRLLWMPIVLFFVTLLTFTLGFYGPGDPVKVMMGQHNDPGVEERLRAYYGLDQPFHVQYAKFIWNAVHLDFGESFRYRGTPVSELLAQRVWVSAQMGIAATLVSLIAGLALGLWSAVNQGKAIDTAVVTFALLLGSLPVFIVQPVLVLVLSRWLKLVPSSGWGGLFDLRIIMPLIVLSLGSIGALTRMMRASTLEVIGQDFVRTARAKGLSETSVLIDHVSRVAVLPISTVLGLSLATLVEGAFITETLFGLPGVGRLMVDSLFNRDYPVIMAMTTLVAVMYVFANAVVDIGYTFLDPRIRIG
ncbi:MAG: ABC transporter permease [Chloroflexi bacterium]|nr:ABC transporter permease [Chloroflexota bacterium]